MGLSKVVCLQWFEDIMVIKITIGKGLIKFWGFLTWVDERLTPGLFSRLPVPAILKSRLCPPVSSLGICTEGWGWD